MKKYPSLFMVLVLLLMDCSKSADPVSDPLIVGTWIQSSLALTGCTDTSKSFPELLCADYNNCLTYVLLASGRWSNPVPKGIGLTETSGTYTASGGILTATWDFSFAVNSTINPLPHSSTYLVTATTLILSVDRQDIGGGCKSVTKYTRQ